MDRIREQLDDDTIRLVYADWLQERDRVDEADLIRLQCQAERLRRSSAGDPHTLEERAQRLIANHQAEWLKPWLDCGFSDAIFRRGLLEEIHVKDTTFAEQGSELLRNAPPMLRKLKLLSGRSIQVPPAAQCLAACPELLRLDAIDFEGRQIGNRGVQAIADSPFVANLQELNLEDSHVGNQGVEALTASEHLVNLQRLNLAWNQVGDSGINALANSPLARHLTHLELTGNDFTDEGLESLAKSTRFEQLQHLKFRKDWDHTTPPNYTAEGMKSLAAGSFPSGMVLEFRGYCGLFSHFKERGPSLNLALRERTRGEGHGGGQGR